MREERGWRILTAVLWMVLGLCEFVTFVALGVAAWALSR